MSTETRRGPLACNTWHGMLCAANAVEVAERIQQILDGHHFTLVAANSYSETKERFCAIDVRTSLRLREPVTAKVDEEWTYIPIPGDRQHCGLSTRAKTQQEGRDGKPHDYIHLRLEPYRITIDHYAPAGYRLQWIFATEHHETEDE